jgi:hypothetical protein
MVKGGVTSDPADALFKVPLAEFTAARNALVTKLKKAGKPDEAATIKGMVKPSISAWAVNQLHWQHSAAFDKLLAAGERFRQAQAAQLSGKSTDLRAPLEARREILADLTKRATEVLHAAGHSATPDVMRRITSTLEALSIMPGSDGPRPGRLIDDVDPPGFEALAALVPRNADGNGGTTGPSRVLTFRERERAAKQTERKVETAAEREARAEQEQKAHRAAVKAALVEAERALKAARKAAEQSEVALKKAAAHAKEADQERAAAEKLLEKTTAAADEARQQARKTAGEAEEAAQAVEDAERALAKATAALEELE